MPATRSSTRPSTRSSARPSTRTLSVASASKASAKATTVSNHTRLVAIQPIQQASAIELVIPQSIPKDEHWAPGRYEPSVTLSRVEFTSPTQLPDSSPKDVKGPFPVISITERIGAYDFVDQYFAAHDNTKLVVRLIDLAHFPHTEDPSREAAEQYLVAQAHVHKLAAEIAGVPTLAGVFAKGTLYCLVYEDFGRQLLREEKFDDKQTKDQVIAVAQHLDAVGLALGLVHWRDIWRGPDGQIKIVHFEYVHYLENVTQEEIERIQELQDKKDLTAADLMATAGNASVEKTAELFLYPDDQ